MKENNKKEKIDYAESAKKALFKTLDAVFVRFASALKTAQIFNTTRVKFDFLSYSYFKLLSNEFRKKEIGTVGFDHRLEQEELAQFVYYFANVKVKEKNSLLT